MSSSQFLMGTSPSAARPFTQPFSMCKLPDQSMAYAYLVPSPFWRLAGKMFLRSCWQAFKLPIVPQSYSLMAWTH